MLQLAPWLKTLTIKDKNLQFVPFDLYHVDPKEGDFGWAQRRFVHQVEKTYNAGKPVRIITLKARQLGISTVTEAILFLWGFIHHGTNGLVMAHENTASLELFEMTKLYWDRWEFRNAYTLQSATKQNFHWAETRSRLRVATARNIQSGRASTLHAVHASEVAFYPDPKTLMLGLSQTIPNRHGSIVVLESTANGLGNFFYDEWCTAEEGGSDYIPLFFPWHKHPEYRLTTTLSIESELNADERQLIRIGASMENIAWRRWAIVNLARGDMGKFMQEYPSTPEEAFITTGRPIFNHQKLKDSFKHQEGFTGRFIEDIRGRVHFQSDHSGQWTVFIAPKKGDTRWDRYFAAGDPSETITGDPACIQVINRQSLEQVAVWHGRINPLHFADEMILAGKYYNEAMLCPEVEGGGQATISRILTRNYPNVWLDKRADRIRGSFNVFGWATNYNRKRWAIGKLQQLIIDGSLTIHDRKTYNQLRNYVEDDTGYWGNADKEMHDDAVMALAIAVIASDQEGPFTADPPTRSAIHDLYAQQFDTA
jgi:Terminase RNaseH-like domain